VRNLYTPAGGTAINNVNDLQANKAYIVGGQKFKPLPQVIINAILMNGM